jgi:hypothetical protein
MSFTAGSHKLPGASYLFSPSYITMTKRQIQLMIPIKLAYASCRIGKNNVGVKIKKDMSLVETIGITGNRD